MPATRNRKRGESIAGIVQLADADEFDNAVLIVALHDVSWIDAPSRTVAERTYRPISGRHSEFRFCLALPGSLPTSASYSLKAEIRRGDPKALRSGDYLSTAAHPWSAGETNVVIAVRKI